MFLVLLSILITPSESYSISSLFNHCKWYNNTCVEQCPSWMVEVRSNCHNSTTWTSQLTCDDPDPVHVTTICGYSRCDCPDALVWEKFTGQCYDVDNCPTIHSED